MPQIDPKAESVVRILQAAEVCFARAGFNGTSLKQIAQEARVSKALIHYHFDSKEGLLLEVLTRIHHAVAHDIQRLAGEGPPGIETAMRALDELAHAMLRITPLTPVFVELGAIALERSELQERTNAFVFDTIGLIEAGIHQTLGEATERLIVPPSRLARLLHATVHGIALSAIHGGSVGLTQQLEDLKTLLRASLTPASQGDTP